MMIRAGWTIPPYGRQKFDIEVDETDLARLVREAGAPDAEAACQSLTTLQAFELLNREADYWAARTAADKGVLEDDEARAEVRRVTERRTTMMDWLRRRYASGG